MVGSDKPAASSQDRTSTPKGASCEGLGSWSAESHQGQAELSQPSRVSSAPQSGNGALGGLAGKRGVVATDSAGEEGDIDPGAVELAINGRIG